MTIPRSITMKPAFIAGVLTLPLEEVQQVIAALELLGQDPAPDGKSKKHLTHLKGKPHRIRSGNHRILYTFDTTTIHILTLRKRDEATYNLGLDVSGDFEADLLEDLEEPVGGFTRVTSPGARSWEHYLSPLEPENKLILEPLTTTLLNSLRVPPTYHTNLQQLKSEIELLSCPDVPAEILLRIDQYLFELPLRLVEQQPDLILNSPEDLLYYKKGELPSFPLKLSPEQEKYAHWAVNATSPTLVKGGPGTGKSTLAFYRLRSLLDQLLRTNTTPRLLFTTYTNALVQASEHQLQQLLGERARYVEVQTAAQLASTILQQSAQVKEIASLDLQSELLAQAIASTPVPQGKKSLKQALTHIGNDYLLQELNTVIVARQIESLEEYLATPRTGRKVRLSAPQHQHVWRIYDHWCKLLQASGKETWQQQHARAVSLVEQSNLYQQYDAVVIDEAQDLNPSQLRLLVNLCKTPGRLFITADANQSIHSSSFTWADVHGSLRVQGRTAILHANYRSTYDIGEAAQSYLTNTLDTLLDTEISDRHYVNNGPLPDVRTVINSENEAQLLANFFKKASLSLRLTTASCAVFCPNERVGQSIATALRAQAIDANFMHEQDLDLTRSGVKVLTLKSAKGLEFPIVALVGFLSGSYPVIPDGVSPDERNEILACERRRIFVAMTRATHALLVILPFTIKTPLLQGFDPALWNVK